MLGAAGTLWHCNFKTNVADFGFNLKFHILGADAAEAKPKALEIATAYRRIMPADSEIFDATISNDNTKRDSKFLENALGAGLFINAGVAPPATFVDNAFNAVKVRLEHDDGAADTRKINPVPDAIVEKHRLTVAITSVTATFAAAAPAAGDLTDYALQFNNLMKVITKNAIHVRSGHAAGGDFTYFPYTAAYVKGVGKKKGGKAFV